MATESVMVRIGEDGAVTLPSRERQLAGLEPGEAAVIQVADGELRIRSLDRMIDELQRVAAKYFDPSVDSVDQFLADRRKDWGE